MAETSTPKETKMDTTTITEQALAVIGAYSSDAEMEQATGFRFLEPGQAPKIGQVAVTFSRGKLRRGLITKVGKTNATVTYTTQGAVDEAERVRLAIQGQRVDEAGIAKQTRANHEFYTKRAAEPGRFDTPEQTANYAAYAAEGIEVLIARHIEAAHEADAQRKLDVQRPLVDRVTVTNKSAHFDLIAVDLEVLVS